MKELLKNILREESVQYITENYPSLRLLANASEKELQQIPSVGPVKAKEIKAIFDISKTLLKPEVEVQVIKSPQDVYNYLQIMSLYETEQFVGIYLDTKNHIIDTLNISQGSVSTSIVHPREFFNPAIRMRVSGVVAVHNHPSGNCEPSIQDIETTQRLVEAGKIIGINFMDHVIIGRGNFCSLKERGLI